MRLRIFDLAVKWFWIVIFWKEFDKTKLTIYFYRGVPWCPGWIHFWMWEKRPNRDLGYEHELTTVGKEI